VRNLLRAPGCKFIEPINDLAVAATLTCRARAEKQGFNVTLERSFDPAAGQADVFPQDITRVL
jgi:hypothetical protein